jgi:glutaredoxin
MDSGDSDPDSRVVKIELFTRPQCPRCVELKRDLSKRGIKFVERVLDFDIPTSEVVKMFPGQNLLPILSVNGWVLGGLPELEDLIERGQLHILFSREPEAVNAG